MADEFFWSLKNEIETEYRSLELGLSNISDDDLSDALYKRFSRQIDHIQDLFDRISEVNKELDLDQSNPDLYKLLEAKQDISACYGQFNRQRSIFFKRFAKYRASNEEDLVRARALSEDSEPLEETPEPEDDFPEDDILPDEEMDPEDEKAVKKAEREARQKKLAAAAKKQDQLNAERRLAEQRIRQEEAARLGMDVRPGQSVSEADLYQERLRQEEYRARAEAQTAERIAQENEALRRTRERLEQSERFERLRSSHIDMSREGIGHTPSDSSSNPSDSQPKSSTFIPYEFTPSGVVPAAAAGWSQASDSNAKIYSALVTNREPDSEPLSVSSAFETQMRFNVERARLACIDAQGTDSAPEAVHEYILQRNALSEYRSAVKQGMIRVSEPSDSSAQVGYSSSYVENSPSHSALPTGAATVYSFTPTGAVGQSIENGHLTGTRMEYNNPGLKGKPAYSAQNPMIVSPQYEAAITNKMRSATESLNSAIVQGETRAHSVDPLKVKMYTDAYLAFQRAKREGTVVVSSDSSGAEVPDYHAWQQRRLTQNFRSATGTSAVGVTGQTVGANPNQTSKKTVDEAVANIFNRGSHLKQQSVAAMYAKQIGERFESYSYGAALRFSQQMYRMIQNGDDNALRTMEQGRYYITTAAGVVLAVSSGSPTKGLENRVAKASAKEFNLYGTKSLMSNSQLSASVNNSKRMGRELDAKIAEVEKDLAPFHQKMAAYSMANPKAGKLDGLDKYSQFQYQRLESQLKQLNAERTSTYKTLTAHQKLQAMRRETKLEADLLKKLQVDGKLPTNPKKLQEAARKINEQASQEMQKKYGSLTKVTDKSLEQEISLMKKQGRELKKQIKLLEDKGAALSASERKLLMDLKAEAKKMGQKVGIYTNLGRDRGNLFLVNKKLDALIKKAYQNKERLSNGLFALQSFMIRPLQAGVDSNTEGLARMIQISSNRYVHLLVKKSFRASVFMTKTGMEALAPGSVQAMEKAAFIAKTTVKANVGIATNAAKKAVHTGVHSVGKSLSHAVPKGIKSGVRSVTSSVAAAKGKFDTVAAGIKNSVYQARLWAAKTRLGRAAAAAARINRDMAEALKAVLQLMKGFALKGLSALALVYLVLGFLSIAFGAIGGAAGTSIIASPDEKDGKVDLSKYVAIIAREEAAFQAEIDAYFSNSKYTNVTVEYGASTNNTKHMLSMMAVRMSQELDMEKNKDVEEYLVSLYDDSHNYTTTETHYKCSGCKERTEYVYWTNPETGQWEIMTREDPYTGLKTPVTKKVKYCPGHIDLTINVSVLTFDEIFTADTYANEGKTANAGEKIGDFKITYYCCEKYPHICNAGPPYQTATGTTPTPNRTIAVDPSVIPLGAHVVIDGKEYVAEDTGGAIKGNRIDIVVKTHQEALNKGTRSNVAVYYPSYEGGSYEKTGKWDGWTEQNIEWCKVIFDMPWNEIYTGVTEYGGMIETGDLIVEGDFVWPVTATSNSSGYGWRIHPVTGVKSFHEGTDIPVGTGTPVHSAAGGTVTIATYHSVAGNYVVVDHGGGIVTRYLHLSQIYVSAGDKVEAGEVVGLSGATGRVTGPHLHFEFIVNGTPIDPRVQYGLS